MPAGRKPTPTVLKLVRGNPGKRKTNAAEAKPPPSRPRPPEWLNDIAQAEWDRVIGALYTAGLMSDLDLYALSAYCMAVARWRMAETALARMAENDPANHAFMVRTSKGTAIQNPLVGVANQAREAVIRAAAEFGMTPSARSRVKAEPPSGKDQDPAAEFFR